ncbi:hypothetical protein HZC27_00495 [Candidatus Roizmanbacteria bacterium]|nr:hypothetical protein [Candidatus Roizmanbacteria bacterium]
MDLLKKQVVVLVCFLLFVGFLFLVQKSLNMPRNIPPVNYTFKTAPQESGYVLVNDNKDAANFTTYLAKSNSAFVPSARFEVKDASVDFSLADSQGKTGFKKANDVVTWENVLPSTDVTFQIKTDGLSQDIVIKDGSLANKAIQARERYMLTLPLNTKNVVPRRDIEGKLTPIFMDAKTKEYRFHMNPPVLVDAKGQTYPFSLVELKENVIARSEATKQSQQSYILNLELPREWITDTSRSFPIRITSGIFYNQQTAFNE